MSKYEMTNFREGNDMVYSIRDAETGLFFGGYNFMGSIDWVDRNTAYTSADQMEIYQMLVDMEASESTTSTGSKRETAGYEIVSSVKIDDKHEIVIGKHPTAPARYVCWDCTNGDSYSNGGYCMSFRQALLIMAERITSRYDSLPVEV